MIKSKTVFVLGAGASHPYGFPLGRDLLFDVCTILANSQSPARDLIKGCYAKTDLEIDCFVNELRGSHIASVDAFLENRPDYLSIGKPAIALALIPYERFEKLVRKRDEYNWYEYLYQQMGATREAFRESAKQLSFITFNYDRSLEFFFFYSLVNSYAENDARDLFGELKIVHVYGKLGELEFLGTGGRGFAPDLLSKQDIEKCVSDIKIMPERSEEANEFKNAHQLVGEAQQIHFLGFGYDETNVRRLKIPQLFKGIRLQGTTFKLGLSELSRVANCFVDNNGRTRWAWDPSWAQYDILNYLKNLWQV
jgi:hypothetical protein